MLSVLPLRASTVSSPSPASTKAPVVGRQTAPLGAGAQPGPAVTGAPRSVTVDAPTVSSLSSPGVASTRMLEPSTETVAACAGALKAAASSTIAQVVGNRG